MRWSLIRKPALCTGVGALAAGHHLHRFSGLPLMIPNMYKIAAEQLPCVFDVSARTVATSL